MYGGMHDSMCMGVWMGGWVLYVVVHMCGCMHVSVCTYVCMHPQFRSTYVSLVLQKTLQLEKTIDSSVTLLSMRKPTKLPYNIDSKLTVLFNNFMHDKAY